LAGLFGGIDLCGFPDISFCHRIRRMVLDGAGWCWMVQMKRVIWVKVRALSLGIQVLLNVFEKVD
jgi:hypothetical protein